MKLVRPNDIPSDYILNTEKSFFSVVVPEEGSNLVWNPEVASLTGFFSNGNISLSTDYSKFGLYSLKAELAKDREVYYLVPQELNINTFYTFSVYVRGSAQLEVSIKTNAPWPIQDFTQIETSNGFWYRIVHTVFVHNNPSQFMAAPFTNCRLHIRAKEDCVIYLDGWQLEDKPYATTFISGNQTGFFTRETPMPYHWAGVPHNSPSVRNRSTRAGGRVVNFHDCGILVTGFEGLGLPEFENFALPLINRNGSLFQNTTIQERNFTILGIMYSKELNELNKKRAQIINGVSPFVTSRRQPMKLIYQTTDCDKQTSDEIEINCLYTGGLEGDYKSFFGERIALEFQAFDVFLYRTGIRTKEVCTQILASQVPGASSQSILYRDSSGQWRGTPPKPGLSTQLQLPEGTGVNAFEIGPDNFLYIGSTSSTLDGFFFRYDGQNITTLGWGNIGEVASVRAIKASYDNKLYVGGQFRHITNGSSNATNNTVGQNVARYNLVTGQWEDFGKIYHTDPSVLATVNTIEQLIDGRIVFGGTFNRIRRLAGIDLTCRNLAIYDPSTNTWDVFPNNQGIGGTFDRINIIKYDQLRRSIWIGGKFIENPPDGQAQQRNITRFGIRSDNALQLQGVDMLTRRAHRTSMMTTDISEVFDIEMDGVINYNLYVGGIFDASGYSNAQEALLPPGVFSNKIPWSLAKFNENGFWEPVGFSAALGFGNVAQILDIERGPDGLYFCGVFNHVGHPGYNKLDNPNITHINPASSLGNYTQNTWGMGKITNLTLTPENSISRVSSPTTWMRKMKIGNFYTDRLYFPTTIPIAPPNIPINVDTGADTTFYTSLPTSSALAVDCITEVDICKHSTALPIITVIGPGKLLGLRNFSDILPSINFNKILVPGEILTIDFTQPIPIIISSFFGLENNIILPGSSLKTFRLINGTNKISLFFDRLTVTNDTKAFISWKETFIDLDTAVAQWD